MSSVNDIPQTQMAEYPDFAALVLNVLLFKLGGQITIPVEQLSQVAKDFPRIRIAMQTGVEIQPQDAQVTLTLISAERHREGGGIYG